MPQSVSTPDEQAHSAEPHALVAYRCIGERLFTELQACIESAQTIVLLSPPYGGKQVAIEELRDRCRHKCDGPVLHVKIPAQDPVETEHELNEIVVQAIRCSYPNLHDGAIHEGAFSLLGGLSRRVGQPVCLLVSNVDNLPYRLCRTFLQQLQGLIQSGLVIAAVSGEFDLLPLVTGKDAVLTNTQAYFLQKYDFDYFDRTVRRYRKTLGEPEWPQDLAQILWKETGGHHYLLRLILATLVERGLQMSIHGLMQLTYTDGLASIYWKAALARANKLISRSPECWTNLDSLLSSGRTPVATPEPTPLEFAGIAIRTNGELVFTCVLMRHAATQYFDGRRRADLFARANHWEQAFDRYSQLPSSLKTRPVDTDDFVNSEVVVRSFSALMLAEVTKGAKHTRELFAKACHYLLGFGQITFWKYGDRWQPSLEGFPVDTTHAQEACLLLKTTNTVGMMLESEDGRAFALTFKEERGDRVGAVTLTDFDRSVLPTTGRKLLTSILLRDFLNAHERATEIERQANRLKMREAQVAISNSILHGLGTHLHDAGQVLISAAAGLRELGYKRVLFCLVDPLQQEIRGVLDNPGTPVDLSKLTRYALSSPEMDIQPYVISTKKSKIVPKAKDEPLANEEAVRRAELNSFAVVPMLDADETPIGTVHIEREDGLVPSDEEILDLEQFGRQLAALIVQSERVNLQEKCLDRIPEPILILDSTQRIRYANQPASKLFAVNSGWRKSANAEHFDGGPLSDVISKGLQGTRVVKHMTGIGIQKDYKGEILFQGIEDWREQIIGGAFHVTDHNYLHRVFDAITLVGGSHDLAQAERNLVEATSFLGHRSGRLYRVDRKDRNRLTSAFGAGFGHADHLARFNGGEIYLTGRRKGHHSWLVFEAARPIVFCWRPDLADGSRILTESGLEVRSVQDPQWPNELEKAEGEFWIDLPLQSGNRDLGKLTIACDSNLHPEKLEMLGVLAVEGAALLSACETHARQVEEREVLIQRAAQRSTYYVAHNLKSRLASLPVILSRYRDLEHSCPELIARNRSLEEIVKNCMRTIDRTKDMLRAVVVRPTNMRLQDFLSSVLDTSLASDQWAVLPKGSTEVRWDSNMMHSVMVELVENSKQAIEGSAGAVRVDVLVEVLQKRGVAWIRMTFQDNGPGVPTQYKSRIFEDFFSRRPGRTVGTGMGLAFVRRAVEAHGGSISEQGREGEGACFEIELPQIAAVTEEGSDGVPSFAGRG